MDVTLAIFIKGIANFINGFVKFVLLALVGGVIVGLILGSVQVGMMMAIEHFK